MSWRKFCLKDQHPLTCCDHVAAAKMKEKDMCTGCNGTGYYDDGVMARRCECNPFRGEVTP